MSSKLENLQLLHGSHDPVEIAIQQLRNIALDKFTIVQQSHMTLEQKLQEEAMESINKGGPTLIVKPFKRDKMK